MAVNRIAYPEKVVSGFLRYQLTDLLARLVHLSKANDLVHVHALASPSGHGVGLPFRASLPQWRPAAPSPPAAGAR